MFEKDFNGRRGRALLLNTSLYRRVVYKGGIGLLTRCLRDGSRVGVREEPFGPPLLLQNRKNTSFSLYVICVVLYLCFEILIFCNRCQWSVLDSNLTRGLVTSVKTFIFAIIRIKWESFNSESPQLIERFL